MAELAAIGTAVAAAAQPYAAIATIAGSALGAAGALVEGRGRHAAANYEAEQLDRRALEEQAAARNEADQLRRRRDLALSRHRAVAAASGFSTTDPTTLAIGEDISRYGTLQEQLAMYGGTSRRAGLEAQADAARFSGDAARTASYWRAGATILGGVGSLANRYNPPTVTRTGGPSADTYYPGIGSTRAGRDDLRGYGFG